MFIIRTRKQIARHGLDQSVGKSVRKPLATVLRNDCNVAKFASFLWKSRANPHGDLECPIRPIALYPSKSDDDTGLAIYCEHARVLQFLQAYRRSEMHRARIEPRRTAKLCKSDALMTSEEIDRYLDRGCSIECPQMVLRQNSETSPAVYEGPGSIYQTSDGELAFKFYARTKGDFRALGRLLGSNAPNVGQIIPRDQFSASKPFLCEEKSGSASAYFPM